MIKWNLQANNPRKSGSTVHFGTLARPRKYSPREFLSGENSSHRLEPVRESYGFTSRRCRGSASRGVRTQRNDGACHARGRGEWHCWKSDLPCSAESLTANRGKVGHNLFQDVRWVHFGLALQPLSFHRRETLYKEASPIPKQAESIHVHINLTSIIPVSLKNS
jgi:hypothetical protein